MHRRTLVKSAAAFGLAGGLGSVAFNAFAAGKIKPGAKPARSSPAPRRR